MRETDRQTDAERESAGVVQTPTSRDTTLTSRGQEKKETERNRRQKAAERRLTQESCGEQERQECKKDKKSKKSHTCKGARRDPIAGIARKRLCGDTRET